MVVPAVALTQLPISAQAILDEIRLIVAVVSLDGRLEYVNGEVLRRSGERAESLIGTRFSTLRWWTHQSGLSARIDEAIAQVARGHSTRMDIEAEFQPGNRIVVDLEVRPVREASGSIVAAVAEGRDVTDQQAAERKLLEAQFRWRTIADFTVDWEFWLHPGGHFLYSSPGSLRLTGYAPDDFMQGRTNVIMLSHPDDRKRVVQLLTEAFSGTTGHNQRFRIVARDGAVRWASLSWQPVRDDNGRFMGVRGSVRDITEQRQAEDDLQRLLQAYQTLARHFPKGLVALLDRQWRFVVCDGPAYQQLGLDQGALVGKRIQDVFGRALLTAAQPLLDGAAKGQEVADVLEVAGAAWLVHLTPIPDEKGEIAHIIASAIESQDNNNWADSVESPTRPVYGP